jgi:chorismate lyase / 3-hydroxybenzoate synthase
VSTTKSNECVVEQGVGTLGVKSAQRVPLANAHALRIVYMEAAQLEALLKASPSNLLSIVHHGQSPPDPGDLAACPVVCLDLPQFNWSPLTEVWTSSLPVTYHEAEGIRFAMNDEVLFGALQSGERSGTRLDSMTYRAYRCLLGQARDLGYPYLLRVWNYFPRINSESDRRERYQRFCVGRHHALAEGLADFPRTLPAGTAVGTMSGPLEIHFLASRQAGMHIENPRQVSAYKYPRSYGPRSPSFARATLCPSVSGSHLLIAGTASVIGHVSEHIGEPHQQTLEIIRNLMALVTHTERLNRVTRGQWYEQALFKVYIRHPEHFSTIHNILKEQLPAPIQLLFLQGEMCRSDLLLEIEGVLSPDKANDVSQTISSPRVRFQQSLMPQHVRPDRFTRQ